MFKRLFIFLTGWKLLVLIAVVLASKLLPLDASLMAKRFSVNIPYLFSVWANFDGLHYLEIADRGYFYLEQGFFPLYPLFIHFFFKLSNIPYLYSVLIVSHLVFILSLVVFGKLLVKDKMAKGFSLLLLIVLLFPTSFFYGAVYNDSLFLLFSSLCLFYGRQKSWILAGTMGCLATLTRLNGLALLIYLLCEYLTSGNNLKKLFNLKKIRQTKIFAILLIPLAFFLYLVFIQTKFGDWQLLFKSMTVWSQDKMVLPPQVIFRYLKILFFGPASTIIYWVAAAEFAFVLFYFLALVYSWKKIRFSYFVFMAVSFLIPSLTGTFAGMPRYGLHLYPFFLTLLIFLEKQKIVVRVLYFFLSLILLGIFVSLFTRGYFVA